MEKGEESGVVMGSTSEGKRKWKVSLKVVDRKLWILQLDGVQRDWSSTQVLALGGDAQGPIGDTVVLLIVSV